MDLHSLKDVFFRPNEANLTSYRLYHGRGKRYDKFQDFSIDIFQNVVFIVLFNEREDFFLKELILVIKEHLDIHIKAFICQHRYLKPCKTENLEGETQDLIYAEENFLKYHLSFGTHQNPGFFMDMRLGRQKLEQLCHNKNVLNLFSYTCSFSVCAMNGGAKSVINVDMKSNCLKTGKDNHILNNIPVENVRFLKHNVMKSFAKLSRLGPYEIIIIDPPSFQKDSFNIEKDYVKIIKKIHSLSAAQCDILACLNAPLLPSTFLSNLFNEFLPEFKLLNILSAPEDFPEKNPDQGLKILHYQKNG